MDPSAGHAEVAVLAYSASGFYGPFREVILTYWALDAARLLVHP